jgi:predicted acyl esterase
LEPWQDDCCDAWMVCDDGVALATRFWRPPQGQGPWPALLMRQPYGRRIASSVVYAHPRWYAAHGFLVVVQDVRGRGDSGGRFGGFAQEAGDGRCAVRWLRRHPACNGRVGTYGFSYQGLSQLLIGVGAQQEADLPDALAPAMAGLDERRHWAAEGGAHWWAPLVGWGLQLAAEGCRRRDDGAGWQEIRRALESGTWPRQGEALLQRLDPQGMVARWLRQDPGQHQEWVVHEPVEALLRRPLLLIGGWHDPHLRGVLDLWRRSRSAGGQPTLLIGAWSHLDWQGGVDGQQLAFFRDHLQGATGEGEGSAAPAPAYAPHAISLQDVLGGDWRAIPAPAPGRGGLGGSRGERLAWRLASGGLAAVRSDEGELREIGPGEAGTAGLEGGRLTLVHDPWRPVPGRGGHLGPEPGLVERGDLDGRCDVACFTSAPLAADLELLGEPRLVIRVRGEGGGFDLCAALSVVSDGEDRVRQLCVGMRRRVGPRAGGACHDSTLRLRLQPLRATLGRGERLRLSLAGAAWPQIAVHPGTDGLAPGPSGPGHRVIPLEFDLTGARLWLAPLMGAG